MTTDYGSDWSTSQGAAPDLDPYGRLVSGVAVVSEAVARRLTTPLGTLPGDPLYGFDVRTMLSASGPATSIAGTVAAKVRSQVLADPRVDTATITQSRYDAPSRTLVLGILCTCGAGPFELVFRLNPAGIELIVGGTA